MKKIISSLMIFITLFSLLPNVLAGKNGIPFQDINDPKYVEFLKDCDNVVEKISKLPAFPLANLRLNANIIDSMYEAEGYTYPEMLCLYSYLVTKSYYQVCQCRHFAAYAFLKLHNIGKRCFNLCLYDENRIRKRDHAIAIYSVMENGEEIWKVCDISFAIEDKIKNTHDYKKWLSIDLIDYLNANDITRSFGGAIALDDPGPDNCFCKQNANDLKLYLAKYTPNYAKYFIQYMDSELHIRNINAINTAFGTSSDTIGAEERKKLIDKQRNFLDDFIDGKAKSNEAPNV